MIVCKQETSVAFTGQAPSSQTDLRICGLQAGAFHGWALPHCPGDELRFLFKGVNVFNSDSCFPNKASLTAHTPLLTRQHFQYFSTPVSALFYCRLRRANSEPTIGRMLSFIETSSIQQMGLLPLNSASLEFLEHGQSSQILGQNTTHWL